MRSLERRYIAKRDKYPEPYSSYVCFVRAIRGQNFSYEIISKWFNILIDKDDYARNERKCIVEYLFYLSNMPKEKEFGGKNCL